MSVLPWLPWCNSSSHKVILSRIPTCIKYQAYIHRPLNYFERDADHAVEFMRQIGHDRFSAVGWSDGGITGLVAASRHPAAVERLAVWGANAHVTDKDMEMLDKVADVAQGWIGLLVELKTCL